MADRSDDTTAAAGFAPNGVLPGLWESSRGSISVVLVGLCTFVFLTTALLSGLHIVPRQMVFAFLGLSYAGIVHRLWLHQFITAPLLHGSVLHLTFNMLSLWMLGPELERSMGRRRYVVFSILCAIASMVGFLIFNWETSNVVVGYSGVIFGLLVAQAMFFPENRVALFGFFPLRMKHAALLLGGVELYLTIVPEDAGISHAAHLFGALAAVIYFRGQEWRRKLAIRLVSRDQRRPVPRSVPRKQRRDIPREL